MRGERARMGIEEAEMDEDDSDLTPLDDLQWSHDGKLLRRLEAILHISAGAAVLEATGTLGH